MTPLSMERGFLRSQPLGCNCGCPRDGAVGADEAPATSDEHAVAKLVLGFAGIIGMMGIAVLIANRMEGA